MPVYTLLATVELPLFPIHLPKTKNVTKENKMWKVNGQSIYSGTLNEFARSIVVENAHNYIIEQIKAQGLENLYLNHSMVIVYEITSVINHGTISLRKGNICWKPASKTYEPTWDVENLASFWTKVGNDALSLGGVIVDDNVRFIKGTSHIFKECSDINERIIKIKIYKYE